MWNNAHCNAFETRMWIECKRGIEDQIEEEVKGEGIKVRHFIIFFLDFCLYDTISIDWFTYLAFPFHTVSYGKIMRRTHMRQTE